MEFDLEYQGPLPSCTQQSNRIKEKQYIRSYLHAQLNELWRREPLLPRIDPKELQTCEIKDRALQLPRPILGVRMFFAKAELAGYLFVPIVTRAREVGCEIDIRFWRREDPGAIIQTGGDLDNRLKTLFDALRMPHNTDEVPQSVEPTPQICFCLLEDDSLISKICIDTTRLLSPPRDNEKETHVRLTMHVSFRVIEPMNGNLGW